MNCLSDAQISQLAKQAADIYESEGFAAGRSFCRKMLQEYQNSISLKFNLGSLFQSFLPLAPRLNKEKIPAYYRRAAVVYEEVLAGGQPKYVHRATVILIVCYTMLKSLTGLRSYWQHCLRQR